MTPTDADRALAQAFHEAYERLAPDFSYETRVASRKPWYGVPENNRALMIAVAAEVMRPKLDQARVDGAEAMRKAAVVAVGQVYRDADSDARDVYRVHPTLLLDDIRDALYALPTREGS